MIEICTMSPVSELLRKYKTLSIVGMAKNAGKTTALTYLLEYAGDEGIIAGVTSTGRDGEASDILTGTPKPKVYLCEGCLFSVPEDLLKLCENGFEILKRTGYRSALGPVFICRAAEDGYFQIGGPGSVDSHRMLCKEMFGFGAELLFIDGAADRRAAAVPVLSDAVIISTGAALSRDLRKVTEETLHVVRLYETPVLEDRKAAELLSAERSNLNHVLSIDDEYRVHQVYGGSALLAGTRLDSAVNKHTKYLFIPGALTDSILEVIDPVKFSGFTLVLPDPTKVFVGAAKWQQFKKKGLNAAVLRNIKVAAVTVNPYSPGGWSFDPPLLLYSVRDALDGKVPVYDVISGGFEQ